MQSSQRPMLGRSGPGGGGLMIRREKMPINYPIENQYLLRLGNEKFRVGVCLMQGLRDEMEDAHSACLDLKNHPDCGFFAVYDGHNGTQASLWAAKNIGDGFSTLKTFTPENIKEKMLELDGQYLKSTTDENAGATSVFAIISAKGGPPEKPYKIMVGNLGDSRCIIGHKDSNSFDPMTTDHKPDTPSEEARIVAAGGIVARGRVDCHLAVARAIGDGAYKKNPSLPPDKQKVVCVPDITEAFLSSNDFVFICCDGIFETFKSEEALEFIHKRLKKTDDTAKILSELLTETLKRGSKDNMTAMIIEARDGRSYNKGEQFIPGEFYEKGNKTWLTSYQTDCERYNKTLDEAKEILLAMKNQKESPTNITALDISGLPEKQRKEKNVKRSHTSRRAKIGKDSVKKRIVKDTNTPEKTDKPEKSDKPEKNDKNEKNEKSDTTTPDKPEKERIKTSSHRNNTIKSDSLKKIDTDRKKKRDSIKIKSSRKDDGKDSSLAKSVGKGSSSTKKKEKDKTDN